MKMASYFKSKLWKKLPDGFYPMGNYLKQQSFESKPTES